MADRQQTASAESHPPAVLCVGDLVADIFAHPVPRLPQPGEMLLSERIAVFPGGNALNTAVALRRLGAPTAIAGSVGDDPIGDLLLAQLRQISLDVRGVRREPGGTTAATLIFRVEGEDRRYVHSLGVAADFTGGHVPPELIPSGGVLFVGGYLKLAAWDDEALSAALVRARKRNTSVVLNVSIPREGPLDASRCLKLLPHVDVFVPNADEARLLTGETSPDRRARALRQAGARAVVITQGPDGLFADDGERIVEMGVFPVSIVDPSGCGDCFTAGLIWGLLHGWDAPETLRFASAAGALAATALGCTTGVPPAPQVEEFLREHDVEITTR